MSTSKLWTLDGRENVLNKIKANLLKHVFPLALNKAPINHENYSCFRDEKTEYLEILRLYILKLYNQPEKENSGFITYLSPGFVLFPQNYASSLISSTVSRTWGIWEEIVYG